MRITSINFTLALSLACLPFLGCAEGALNDEEVVDGELSWVSPDPTASLHRGEPIQLAVASPGLDVQRVRFAVDGVDVATCASQGEDAECRAGDLWRWSVALGEGEHRLTAHLDDGTEIERLVTVRGAFTEVAPITPLASARGTLDPNRPFHNIFGGISWSVSGQRVVLRSATPSGNVSVIRTCMARYGASIRRWADAYKISRASVVATAITESNCTNPRGSSDGLSSGPMQVTGSTCAALMGISASTCKARMHSSPDFSFQVGAKYIASAYQRRQHASDPPKIAAAYNAGSVRRTSANRWHMVSTGNHIDRFVTAYNGYRRWEAAAGFGATPTSSVELTWSGTSVASVDALPASAAEGTTLFVGDLPQRDGAFYTFLDGAWSSSADE